MIHVIICGWRPGDLLDKCIASIDMQSYQDRSLHIKIDNDEDRRYLVERTVDAIYQACPKKDDIIVCVDADDWLADEKALEIVAKTYEANPELLLTYGSYVNLSTNKTGKFCAPYLQGEDFRTSPWRGSHLKTFKYKLWEKIPRAALCDANGEYFKCCADRAMMIPMMEMAGHDRIAHIPMILYCYYDTNPLGVWNTNRQLSKDTREYISAQKPFSRLETI